MYHHDKECRENLSVCESRDEVSETDCLSVWQRRTGLDIGSLPSSEKKSLKGPESMLRGPPTTQLYAEVV